MILKVSHDNVLICIATSLAVWRFHGKIKWIPIVCTFVLKCKKVKLARKTSITRKSRCVFLAWMLQGHQCESGINAQLLISFITLTSYCWCPQCTSTSSQGNVSKDVRNCYWQPNNPFVIRPDISERLRKEIVIEMMHNCQIKLSQSKIKNKKPKLDSVRRYCTSEFTCVYKCSGSVAQRSGRFFVDSEGAYVFCAKQRNWENYLGICRTHAGSVIVSLQLPWKITASQMP